MRNTRRLRAVVLSGCIVMSGAGLAACSGVGVTVGVECNPPLLGQTKLTFTYTDSSGTTKFSGVSAADGSAAVNSSSALTPSQKSQANAEIEACQKK